MQLKRNQLWIATSVVGVAAGFLGYWLHSRSKTVRVRRHIAARLPLAKPLRTIPDFAGNYDIDGVSFDDEGTVVSGDNSRFHH